MHPDAEMPLRARLRRSLTTALKARDQVAVAALRATLGAIDNAEAVDAAHAPVPEAHARIAGGVAGPGAGEVARRSLDERAIVEIVRGELAERLEMAAAYQQLGQAAHATQLRHQAEVIAGHLDDADGVDATRERRGLRAI